MMNGKAEVILDRFIVLAQRDPRKTTVVAVVTFVMLSLSSHFLMDGPAAAPAMIIREAPSGNAAAEPVAPVQALSDEAVGIWLKEPVSPAKRNLFALNLDDYPTEASSGSGGAGRLQHDQKDQILWDDVAKSLATQADQKREQDFRMKVLQQAAAKLLVQKVDIGPPAKAQVNGEWLEEGGFVASFRILRIEAERITLEKDGITLDVPVN
jgi:hypothetical protein